MRGETEEAGPMRVITMNLNGVRSAYRKEAGAWLAQARPDILCWQEVRASDSDLTKEMQSPAGLRGEFAFAQKKGYSGVALFARKTPQKVWRALGGKCAFMDEEGRFLRMDFEKLSVISLYMPSGSSGDIRQQVKYMAMDALLPRLRKWKREAEKAGRDMLICGDINIAHTEKDIRNWRGNLKNSGFLPEERAWLSRLFGKEGWVDVFRRLDSRDGQYTWWSNRGRARENNVGWRIDYQIATPALAARARRAFIHSSDNFSDHAPLIIDYKSTIR